MVDRKYKRFTIDYNPKPIPPRCGVDWDYWHDEYDGPESYYPCGNAGSEEGCKEAIDEWYDEQPATIQATINLIDLAINVLTDEQLDQAQPSLGQPLRDYFTKINTTDELAKFARALDRTWTQSQLNLQTECGIKVEKAMEDAWTSIVEEREQTIEKHFESSHFKVVPDTRAPCCKHGRQAFCVCGGRYSCPRHGGSCFGAWGHD